MTLVDSQLAVKSLDENKQERLFYLDWLRIFATLLLFFFHAARVFSFENNYVENDIISPTLVIFFIFVFILFLVLSFLLNLISRFVPFAFITGGFFSALAGYIGMTIATRSNARTAWAAQSSLNSGLRVAFSSGTVMGMVVVGLGLLDLSIWWLVLTVFDLPPADIPPIMITFGMGASSFALFARVGGGIYTKAADVGADLVGKVEAGIPEDDPRNPAVIADNVGDNVGDVAGMGADLY